MLAWHSKSSTKIDGIDFYIRFSHSCNSLFLESRISPNLLFILLSRVIHVCFNKAAEIYLVVHRYYKVVIPWERYVLLFY